MKTVLTTVPHPISSYDPNMPKFDERRYWRGPTWAFMNMLTEFGLAGMGHGVEAEALRLNTDRLSAGHGFSEYCGPITGNPARGNSFTWTATVWLH
ncbi:MGH1-like glycoside hydrolase domain-containing protein [Ruegeria sp. MALMAid1280]|uniref:MGH1-like glycoside hydrolase domain-containing protein n=1 Tax=Ruegeria sp. MALMAid1280 TaxID=3411634 RepID=UPI003BA1A542